MILYDFDVILTLLSDIILRPFRLQMTTQGSQSNKKEVLGGGPEEYPKQLRFEEPLEKEKL